MIEFFYISKTQEIYFIPQKMNSLKDRYRKSGHSTCVVFESEIWKPHCLSPREIGPFENVLLFFFFYSSMCHTLVQSFLKSSMNFQK